MELAMATGSSSCCSLVTGLRCRTCAAAAFSSAGDRRRSWRTTPVTASGRGARRLTVSAAACKTCKGKGAGKVQGALTARGSGSRAALPVAKEVSHPSSEGRDRE
ncbi:unnamed protein product [Miscanthus lutarioriparius]|uniref:Uncharacterized protein n=1 Tax=Miscanthus lutarioriparius TaxID=422564 RepID=A0A811N4R2_9POAL|nr:unnamed protein product [Miscanthus lutarioriparius]